MKARIVKVCGNAWSVETCKKGKWYSNGMLFAFRENAVEVYKQLTKRKEKKL